jgi:Xaa-Pro aminopeptidase
LQSAHENADIGAQLTRRRAACVDAWRLTDEVVVIGAGEPISIPGRADLTYPFKAHSEYFYLTDRNRPGGVLAFDPQDGWIDFVTETTVEERLWTGADDSPEPGATPASEFAAWLGARTGRPVAALGVPPAGFGSGDAEVTDVARDLLARVRRPKDAVELDRMRHAEQATAAAFAAAVPFLRDGVTERRAQVELESEAFRHGADEMAYDSIVGTGTNSAVLHFPPSERVMRTGDLVLIDAGAEYHGYASDITRTYPVGGEFASDAQRELHSLVRGTELACIERCTSGTEWRDVHLLAATMIAEGLVSFGLLRGDTDALVESGAVWLFFPHGIGHLLGLGVRDAGGILAERKNDPPPYPHLRIDLPLAPGMVVTVEPGIYFVPALLSDREQRTRHADHVDWDRVDRMLDFGGIRIEDNVLVTSDTPEVLTADVPLLG